ncbi:MAG TPA: hypothetical protein VNI83_11065 [Vicinamibacterales bacterium]|nr:hypothetical protein [Vicinamibacterales bacterium]
MDRGNLRRLARLGAQARLQELDRERAAILRAFPELRRGAGRVPSAAGAGNTRPRRRRRFTAAERRAISERMKRYWAERRKRQGK